MKALATDPVVLICCGIILVGLIALFWAFGKFRNRSSSISTEPSTDDLLPPLTEDKSSMDFEAKSPPPMPVMSAAPAVNRDVAERLESMTQRLSEMQAVLARQVPAGAGEPGGVGQGFSPETIDKLLKIIGNVMQQVDILQKSLSPGKEGASAKLESPAVKL